MGTRHYDFTYLDPNANINLVGDTTKFLDEIDAEIKMVDDSALAANASVAALSARIAQPWYLIMGDSWADTSRADTYSQWAKDAVSRYPRCKSYAVSGAQSSALSAQVSAAVSDSAFNNSQVAKIVVIIGVNDFNHDVSAGVLAERLNSFNESVKANFPNAECMIFVDCPNPTCFYSDAYGKTFDGSQQHFLIAKNAMTYGNITWLGYYLPSNVFYDFSQLASGVYHTYHMSLTGNKVMGQLFEAFINNAPLAVEGRIIESGLNEIYYAKVNSSTDGTKTVVDTFNILTRYNTVIRSTSNKCETALYTQHSGGHSAVQNCFEYVVIVPLNKINSYNGTAGFERNYRAEVPSTNGNITPVTSTGTVVNLFKQFATRGSLQFTNVSNGIVNLRGSNYAVLGYGIWYANTSNTVTNLEFNSWQQYAVDGSFL